MKAVGVESGKIEVLRDQGRIVCYQIVKVEKDRILLALPTIYEFKQIIIRQL